MPVYEIFNVSNRDESLTLVTPNPSLQFAYQGPKIWNSIHKKIHAALDLTTKMSYVKSRLKDILIDIQKQGSEIEWQPQNFKI